MAIQNFLVAALATSASAVKLYVSSYAPTTNPLGSVTTLELTLGLGGYDGSASATLKNISSNSQCGSAPTWLDKTPGDGKIYCLDEGFATPNASLNTLTKNADGSLTSIAKVDTIQGPVSTQFYNKNTAVALAHYGGSGISTFKLAPNGTFTPLQNFSFVLAPHGPRPEQEASHVHEAIIDPTGKFLIFPDLGSDLVRIYSICPDTGLLTVQEPIHSPTAYGPRHAAFWSPSKNRKAPTYLFVIHELANRIISYSVTYPANGTITFAKVHETGLYGNQTEPVGTRAAEITVSPDNRFVVASNRNATIFSVANPDPSNSTAVPSDSLVTFKPSADGKLEFQALSPSGGSFPRHFSFNKDGSLIAVGNQNSQTVFVFQRDVRSGKIGDKVASAFGLPGQVTNVLWDE